MKLTPKGLNLLDVLGTDQVFVFSTFSGLAEMPLADKT